MKNQAENSAQWSRSLRLAWMERAAKARGSLQRKDVVSAFGIGHVVATEDFSALLDLHPEALTYDYRARCYRWTGGEKIVTRIPAPVKELEITDS